ncbi:MAG: DUF1190 domain-containing protein [Arsenophonus sp. ET-KM2-MAG3]
MITMKIKRTKDINQNAFRKIWRTYRLSPIALTISSIFILSACEQSDKMVSLYTNTEDCSRKSSSQNEQCSLVYKNELQETIKTSEKHATDEDCIIEFDKEECTQALTQNEVQNKANGNSGSFLIPLMTGYMMRNIIGNSASVTTPATQPQLNSNNSHNLENRKFFNIRDKNYKENTSRGNTITTPISKSTHKTVTTNTITRGGFGESINKKLINMQRKNIIFSSKRSMGG